LLFALDAQDVMGWDSTWQGQLLTCVMGKQNERGTARRGVMLIIIALGRLRQEDPSLRPARLYHRPHLQKRRGKSEREREREKERERAAWHPQP
jgi:hypothetical protein